MNNSSFLIILQLSNYTREGTFVLEADSGFQMVMGRVREFIKHVPNIKIDILGPKRAQLRTQPEKLNPDLHQDNQVRYVETKIIPNALATRYDFDFEGISNALALDAHRSALALRYTHVYVNDPMHLRNFKALFNVKAGYQPKFVVHSHFVDNPEAPKFPTDASLWLGQCEAAIRADFNFWQCESAMNTFFDSMSKTYKDSVVRDVAAKSLPYDDGYSITEITTPVNLSNVRIDVNRFLDIAKNNVVIFVPNRIGGKGRSSDYTNCGKFMFDLLPQLRAATDKKFVVVAGNPSQKFSNDELLDMCGEHGYVKLTEDGFTRDEYKFVASHSHIVLGLYHDDAYGATASRECIELGCLPLWLNVNEYASIAKRAGEYPWLVKPDFSDFVTVAHELIDMFASYGFERDDTSYLMDLQHVVRARCSYEQTTPAALKAMGVL